MRLVEAAFAGVLPGHLERLLVEVHADDVGLGSSGGQAQAQLAPPAPDVERLRAGAESVGQPGDETVRPLLREGAEEDHVLVQGRELDPHQPVPLLRTP